MEHYYTEKPTSKIEFNKFFTKLKGEDIQFYSVSGVFCKSGVDKGSELLIEKCILNKNWKVLDLGCGYGIVGISLLNFDKSLDVTFSDVNERALMACKKNLVLNNLKGKVLKSDGFEKINDKFDTILLNPPQTAGKKLCFKLIEDSFNYLNEKGLLQIVARHNKGGKELSKKMNEVFENVKDTAKSNGFRIYVSEK